jgi:hypothetical protein
MNPNWRKKIMIRPKIDRTMSGIFQECFMIPLSSFEEKVLSVPTEMYFFLLVIFQ